MEKYNDKIAKIDNVELVQVSQDEDVEEASAWAKKESFPWPTILKADIAKTFLKDVKTEFVPTYILFDKEGNELLRSDNSDPLMAKLKEVNK